MGVAARVSAALAVALFSAGAAASSQFGVVGVVMEGPITPVCRVDEPCEQPAVGVVLQFKRASRVAARVRTSQKGTYRVTLRPGWYTVTIVPPRRIGSGLTPRAVRVPNGRIARRDFHLDTGLQ